MKTLFRPRFSLISPSVSSTYTNEGGRSTLFVESPPKSSKTGFVIRTFEQNGGA